MNESDFSDIWFRASDFASFASWNRMTVKMFRQHSRLSDEECEDLEDKCIRGLEHRLKGRNSNRIEIKTNAIYAVLGEQSRRKREGLPVDAQELASLYIEHTLCCASDAANKGHRDEIAAKDLPKVEEPKSIQPHRSQMISHAFDDSDICILRDDFSVTSDEIPVPVSKDVSPKDNDDDSFRAKAKREKRGNVALSRSISFSRFFKKKSSKSKQKQQEATIAKTQEAPVVQRRRCRRSSM
jgi:hypothetical protein